MPKVNDLFEDLVKANADAKAKEAKEAKKHRMLGKMRNSPPATSSSTSSVISNFNSNSSTKSPSPTASPSPWPTTALKEMAAEAALKQAEREKAAREAEINKVLKELDANQNSKVELPVSNVPTKRGPK